jgi:NAD(P)-dependent dehydrogenase (short-subunit alcohol dehydrogenase family)
MHRQRTVDPRVVVITGGTSGVGRAVAERFADEGASVALLARGREGLAHTAAEILRRGGRALPVPVDVARPEQVFAAADLVEQELGPIDVWVNCAMTTVFGRVQDLAPEEYRRVTDVCYHGYVWGTQAALAKMRPRDRGVIIQVGSALAYRAIPLQAAYCGAKHAIRAFTDALRCELLHQDIHVQLTMVQLPAVNTPQFRHCLNKMAREARPVGLIFQPEVAADAIHYAVRHPRREIYVGHTTVEAVIGQKLAPGLLDRFLSVSGWNEQFTERPLDRQRPANLFQPTSGDPGAHGVFDDRARARDPVTQVTKRLGAAGVRVLIALIAPVWGLVVMARRALALRRATRPALPPSGAP